MKDHSISVDQARYYTFIVAKYLDTSIFKEITTFYKTTLPSDMIFTKYDTSMSDEQVEKLTRAFNIQNRACIGSLIDLLSTRVDFSFAVHKLEKFSAKPGKLHFEGLVHIFSYIMYNKTLGLKYYSNINDAPVSELLRQAGIKTDNHFMDSSDSIWQDCPDTGIITRSYIIIYQGGTIDHGTHVPGLVSQSSAES